VPFIDLGRVHAPLKARFLAEIDAILEDGGFTNGAAVAAFEDAFASYCGSSFCVGLASGLDGLRLALMGAGLTRGAEVIVPAQTFVATYEAVTQAGGRPVVVDISETDYNMDVSAAGDAISDRTHCLLPVHLYGQLADVTALASLAARHGISLLEDACQAHGASRNGRRAGVSGLAGAFSFYPGKNLGAIGDAGAITTNDDGLARRVRALREHGQTEKYQHSMEGYTARLDTIQAAVLLQKLPCLDDWNAQRRTAARFYIESLTGVGDLRLPSTPAESEPVWHLYVVRTADPRGLAEWLRARGIVTGRHYPEPPHLSPAYQWLGYREGMFPVAEAVAREALSLPIFPGIREEELTAVTDAINGYFQHACTAS